MIGQTLGHYRIDSKLGEGGVGVVYKARDHRLERTVAIKVLSPEMAQDPEWRSRFKREARTVSALNHPNIVTLHDIGSENGLLFLVMEYLEGSPLNRLMRERKLTLPIAVEIASQVAGALHAAHAIGVVHRDIKPANIFVTTEGVVKVLDFGLSQAPAGPDPSASESTKTAPTKPGVVMGTLPYMSPEQIAGQPLDCRSDIFSFGVTMYEMIAGHRPFSGETHVQLLAAILQHEPPPLDDRMIPLDLEKIIQRCLRKDPKRRFQAAADIQVELLEVKEAPAAPSHEESVGSRPAVQVAAKASSRAPYAALAAVSFIAIALSVVHFREPEAAAVVPQRRFAITPESLSTAQFPAAISPNGKYVVFAGGGPTGKLWLRAMDGEQIRDLGGTEGARSPFWSPDSEYIAFFAQEGKLKRVAIHGGSPQAICDYPIGTGELRGSWSPDGKSMSVSLGYGGQHLHEVASQGGMLRAVPKPVGAGAFSAFQFCYLTSRSGTRLGLLTKGPIDEPTIAIADLDTGNFSPLVAGSHPVYSLTGHILYRPAGSALVIWALPFSLSDLKMAGDPFLVVETGTDASVSNEGTLLYVDPPNTGLQRLIWRDRKGAVVGTLGQPHPGLRGVVLSRDGERAAFVSSATGGQDIWIQDIHRPVATRFTFLPGTEFLPTWAPSGNEVAYASKAQRSWDVLLQSIDGTGEPRTIAGTLLSEFPTDWSSDGKYILITVQGEGTLFDLLYLKRSGSGTGFEAVVLLKTSHNERLARLSPDGRYYAYCSNESGRDEVYVRPFPEGTRKWRISENGGCGPMWSADGKELFYAEEDWLVTVPIAGSLDFSPGSPTRLFQDACLGVEVPRFGVSPDGKRFLLTASVESEVKSRRSIHIVQNWLALVQHANRMRHQ